LRRETSEVKTIGKRFYALIGDGMKMQVLKRRLLCRDGNSAVEYAAILGFIVLAASGVAWLGNMSNRSLSSVFSPSPAGQAGASSAAGNANSGANELAEDESQLQARPDNTNRIAAAAWGASVLGAGLIGLSWFLLNRRRYRPAAEQIPPEETVEPDKGGRLSVKRQALLRILSKDPALLLKNQLAVRHLMTTDVITVSPSDTRQHLEAIMKEEHVRHLLVCGQGRKLLGVVSDRDLRGKAGATAADLMSKQLKVVSSDTLISPATTHIIHSGVSSLPVVQDGQLCGIITTTDLIIALQSLLQLWLRFASTLQGSVQEEEFLQHVQSQADATDDEFASMEADGELLLNPT
jgi:CBS domain-containing protein